MNRNLLNIVASSWVIFLGLNLIVCYFMYERNRIYHSIGNFLIAFSIIKRTKTIILGYGLLALFVGCVGLLMTIAEMQYTN